MATSNSIAEALGRAHATLLADLQLLRSAVHPASGKGLTEVRNRLTATQAHIAEHFRFEEQNGYLEGVRKREPRLDHTIQRLAEEHRVLAQSLAARSEQADTASSLDDSFRDQVRAWIEQVRQHERHENELVQDAFNLDIGDED